MVVYVRPASNLGPLLGRDAEIGLLAPLLDGIHGGGSALVLYGEPGIGKSRLLAVAAALARERGFTVLSTTGVQSEAHLAFAGLNQLLRPLRFHAADLPAAQRAVLDAAFGMGQEPAPERFRIAMAVLDLLCEVATDAPLLVLAEDAQWLDRPTTEVLAFVAHRLQSDPVVLLAAVREGYPSLLVDAGLPQHRLGGLAPAEAMTLLVAYTRPLGDARRAASLIAAAEQAGGAGDRDLQLDMAWLVASRAWMVDPAPSARRVLIEAANRLGDPGSADLRILAIQAYADPFGKAPAVLERVRETAADVHHDADAARFLGPAAVAVGAFDIAATLLGKAVEGLRAQGRLGHLPRMLTLQGSMAAQLADWGVAIPAAEEARRLATELREPQ